MNAKLEQLLAYLDREGVSEVVIGPTRPLAVRNMGQYQTLTQGPPSAAQLAALLDGSPLEGILAAPGKRDVALGAKTYRIEVLQMADGPLAKIALAPAAAVAAPAPAPARAPAHAPAPAPAPAPIAVEPAASVSDEPAGDSELVDERGDVSAIAGLVRQARGFAASDLHVGADRVISVRVTNALMPIDPNQPPLTAADADRYLLPLLGPRRRRQLEEVGYVDLALDVQGAGRLRANISRTASGLRGVFRLGAPRPPTLDELGLPKELAKVVAHHQGLVVIAGPSGHGKTTTLAALVDIINSTKPHHIITIEDPVEVEHPRKMSLVTQREVGRHTKSFVSALKASLREDPDVIVVGELRDRETVEIALTAAETGHLVLATMSTPSAAKTIDRLIDMFPPDEQTQARASIASALRAIVAQRLLPSTAGRSMVPAIELVTGVLPLAVLIRDDKLYQLPNLMQRGRAFGMIRFDESLLELVRTGRIKEDVAREFADSKRETTQKLQTLGAPAPVPGKPR